jgi:two-component system OmpR family response regulator
MRLLVIEDDEETASYLAKGLRESGYTVDRAADGREGLFLATSESYDAMVVDRMLPGMEGLAIVQALRAQGNKTPVLILSALGQVDDRVRGLQAGGDDYLTKPFAFAELLARLQALIRRSTGQIEPTRLSLGDLSLDLLSRRAERNGKAIDLRPREYELLEYLLRNQGRVLTKTMILSHVWGYNFDPGTNVVDVLVSRLREKIDRDFEPKLLQTVRGVGYVLKAS